MNIVIKSEPEVRLIDSENTEPYSVMEVAATNCYKRSLHKTSKRKIQYVTKIVKQLGHQSIAEHEGVIFHISGQYQREDIFRVIRKSKHLIHGEETLPDGTTILSGNVRVFLDYFKDYEAGPFLGMDKFYPSLMEDRGSSSLACARMTEEGVQAIERSCGFKIDHDMHTLKTFEITGPRAMIDQYRTHRMPVFSVESQRYVDHTKRAELTFFPTIKDPNITRLLQGAANAYEKLNGPPEDKRDILPMCTSSTGIVTARTCDWKHIIHVRSEHGVQSYARQVAGMIAKHLDD